MVVEPVRDLEPSPVVEDVVPLRPSRVVADGLPEGKPRLGDVRRVVVVDGRRDDPLVRHPLDVPCPALVARLVRGEHDVGELHDHLEARAAQANALAGSGRRGEAGRVRDLGPLVEAFELVEFGLVILRNFVVRTQVLHFRVPGRGVRDDHARCWGQSVRQNFFEERDEALENRGYGGVQVAVDDRMEVLNVRDGSDFARWGDVKVGWKPLMLHRKHVLLVRPFPDSEVIVLREVVLFREHTVLRGLGADRKPAGDALSHPIAVERGMDEVENLVIRPWVPVELFERDIFED